MTDIPVPTDRPARLKVQFQIRRWKDNEKPGQRQSWEVFGRRFLVLELYLGFVNATGADEALTVARRRWPRERRLSVYPVGD